MLLVADSGSTKCDWILQDGKEKKEFSTMGFNPFFHTHNDVFQELFNSDLSEYSTQVTHVYFYGAGCYNEAMQSEIQKGIEKFFTKAVVSVGHDLTGAVYATCGNNSGITCILGTGSNSCFFDGKTIYEEIPALGYILGDEGSGSYFGKQLLTDFLYKKLPLQIANELIRIGVTKDIIFENVYRKPHANVYLASFAKVLTKFKNEAYVLQVLSKGFNQFIDTHVMCFKNYKEVPVHFVGSVVYHNQDVLESILKEKGIKRGIVTRRPVDNLFVYHASG